MANNNNSDNHMSEVNIIEILSRLPVKSLLRFRCVCNYWYTIIRNSSFITKNLQRKNNNTRLLLQHYSVQISRYSFAIFPDEILGRLPPVYYNFDELEIEHYPDSVVGPFNGIFCLYGNFQDRMFLWNPATREFRRVLVPRPNLPSYIVNFTNIFGFGIDTKINSYKLVWIRHMWDDDMDCPYVPRVGLVYNLSTDSWRLFEAHLDPQRYIDYSLCNNTYMNGVFYWLTRCGDTFHNFMILSFDMGNENFEELPVPLEIPRSRIANLALYIDSVAMILYDPHEVDNDFVIWVMKKQGFWTKQLTMELYEDVMRPLGFWEDGQLFYKTRDLHLVLYNNDTQERKDLGYYNDDGSIMVYIYKESLFSLKEGDNLFGVVQA